MQEQKTVIGCPGALVTTEEKLESGKKRIMQGFVVPVTLLKLKPVQVYKCFTLKRKQKHSTNL